MTLNASLSILNPEGWVAWPGLRWRVRTRMIAIKATSVLPYMSARQSKI